MSSRVSRPSFARDACLVDGVSFADTIHSMTVPGLRLFNPAATVHNSVPTVNHNLSGSELVLPYAPEFDIGASFDSPTMNTIDTILKTLGTQVRRSSCSVGMFMTVVRQSRTDFAPPVRATALVQTGHRLRGLFTTSTCSSAFMLLISSRMFLHHPSLGSEQPFCPPSYRFVEARPRSLHHEGQGFASQYYQCLVILWPGDGRWQTCSGKCVRVPASDEDKWHCR